MSRKISIPLKIVVFTAIFYLLCVVIAFFLKDDSNSYARTLTHEFYNQEKIDYLFCGASHTSHGMNPQIAEPRLNVQIFNTGTPSQKIDGTLAIIKQAVKLYKIQKIFLELDFAITCEKDVKDKTGFKAEYIVLDFLKDLEIKMEYMKNMSTPNYYLNTILPIGKDKLLTLNPKKVFKKIKSVISGDYYKYEYTDSGYAGKGCVLDEDFIENGTFTSGKKKTIKVSQIGNTWKSSIDEIIKICKENNIELVFYSMPGSDFYINSRYNYDEYYTFVKDFLNERGFPYYDFNLVHEDFLSVNDDEYSDDNHLNVKGIEKWTNAFCSFLETEDKTSLFYSSYKQKMENMNERIFGLVLDDSKDKKSMNIIPMTNVKNFKAISYNVIIDDKTVSLSSDDFDENGIATFNYPKGASGDLFVEAILDGKTVCKAKKNFASL